MQLREGTVTQYLHQVIAKIFPNNAFQQFDIVQIANSNRIQLIQDEGVKAIILKSYLYEASTTAVRDNKRTRGLISEIGKHVNVLLGREHKVDNDAIHVELVIKVDGRMKKHARLGESKMNKLANDLVNNPVTDDNYVIVLQNNVKLSPDEIRLQKLVTVEGDGKTLNSAAIKKELLDFYNELRDSKAIEI